MMGVSFGRLAHNDLDKANFHWWNGLCYAIYMTPTLTIGYDLSLDTCSDDYG